MCQIVFGNRKIKPVTSTNLLNSRTGIIFNIQRYALNDGPGIRTTVFLKGCPLRCRWCQNPESFHLRPEIGFRCERCLNCNVCLEACPKDAIVSGDVYRVDPSRCNACGACVDVCPAGALFAIGRRYTVAELVSEVQRDAAFYAESGGGVTLSGGEPLLQFEFAHAFLAACKKAGLNTAIETNGFMPKEKYAGLLPFLDHIYFDLKIMTSSDHKRLTGVDNGAILENARWLVESGAPIVFRVPLVTGMTATEPNIHAMSRFLQTLRVTRVELCPYQDGWEKKLAWLAAPPPSLNMPAMPAEEISRVADIFSESGITAQSGGS